MSPTSKHGWTGQGLKCQQMVYTGASTIAVISDSVLLGDFQNSACVEAAQM